MRCYMMGNVAATAVLAIVYCATMPVAHAAVSAEEAAKLKTTLMPLGGEKAGNADGTIPAWTGGMVDPNYNKNNGRRDDLFKGEKPLFSITAANMAQYADKLTEGTKAMFAKYPDSYRVDVYETKRTAAAPEWVYESTYKNALNGKLVDGVTGPQPSGAIGGTPFPLPKDGLEAIWNHLLSWHGTAWGFNFRGYMVTTEGRLVQTVESATAEQQMPYYFPDMTPEKLEKTGYYIRAMISFGGPPIRAGEGIVGWTNLNSELDRTWVYLTGQRRTRLVPNACCDTPTPASAGVSSFDEFYTFFGRRDRFNWKLIGKKEIYVPYNTNQLQAPRDYAEILSPHSLNPDHVRWELHRVWVVEADLAPGKRHVSPKSTYYIDEDSWNALLGERYDASGNLWKVTWQMPMAMPDFPGQITQTFGFYDLVSGTWFGSGYYNGMSEQYPKRAVLPESFFTPENLAAQGIR